MRSLFITTFSLLAFPLLAQEICDNGIDDDGDGLIDLLDNDCVCNGTFADPITGNLISNPSFDNFDCCPTNFTQLYCSQGWQSLSTSTPDLHHTCDYLGESGLEAGILPPPDGNGAAGIIMLPEWKEYIQTCLNAPLEVGASYGLQLEIASAPNNELGLTCAGGEIFYEEVELTLYGSVSCSENPQIGLDCPTANGPGWQVLGSITYAPSSSWSTVSIAFTANEAIQTLALGAPCELPPSYVAEENFCYPYFYFDNLVLGVQNSSEVNPGIASAGNLCNDNALLTASIASEGGSWQWYLNGIALLGETAESLALSAGNYPAGTYTAVYFLNGDCTSASVEVNDPSDFTATNLVQICENGIFALPDGTIVSEAGTYEVGVANGTECDSLLTYIVELLPLIAMEQSLFLCPGDFLVLEDGEVVTEPGSYITVLPSNVGCDSLITTNVAYLLAPTSFFNWSTTGFFPEIKVSFINLSTAAESYLWEFPEGTATAAFEPEWELPASYTSTQEICLTATSTDGCTDKRCDRIVFNEEFTFYCPNAFSPNLDGLNEGFGPVVRGHDPDFFVFEIWNRWGERIYYSENAEERWIGNNDGGAYYVYDGIYVWQAVTRPLGGTEAIRFKGHVQLIR